MFDTDFQALLTSEVENIVDAATDFCATTGEPLNVAALAQAVVAQLIVWLEIEVLKASLATHDDFCSCIRESDHGCPYRQGIEKLLRQKLSVAKV